MLDVDKSTSLNFPDPRSAFLTGIASMQISETVSIQARQPKEAPSLKWGMALPPVPKAGDKPVINLGGWMYAVPKLSKNQADAWKAIEWINSAEKDYELCKKYNASPRYKANWEKEPFKSDPYNQGLKQLYQYGIKLPINLGLNGVMDAMGGAIQKVWHHEASVDTALAEAEKLANQSIAEAAK
jgi:ABC-type glycerol-3-phosphate transport system substrate-binding protein